MIVYIPLANCQSIFEKVLDSIDDPLVDDVFIHPTKPYSKKKVRHKYITENISGIIQTAKRINDDYFILMNSDIVLKGNEIKCMYDFLDSHADFGCVAYHPSRKEGEIKHAGTSLMMVRTKAVQDIFLEIGKFGCGCLALCNALRGFGWKAGHCGYGNEKVEYLR
ncbi:MAG: hypothetical protein GY861_14770 [bacterium]|nr:hypothetical protein [bacterium]